MTDERTMKRLRDENRALRACLLALMHEEAPRVARLELSTTDAGLGFVISIPSASPDREAELAESLAREVTGFIARLDAAGGDFSVAIKEVESFGRDEG